MNLTERSKCCPSLLSTLKRTKYQRSHKPVWRYHNCCGFYRDVFCLKPCTWHFHRVFGLNAGAVRVNPAPSPRSPSAQSFNSCPVKRSSQFSTEGRLPVHKHAVLNHLSEDFREMISRRKWPTACSGLQETWLHSSKPACLRYHSHKKPREGWVPALSPAEKKVPQGKGTQNKIHNVRFSAWARNFAKMCGFWVRGSVQLQRGDSVKSREQHGVQAPQSSVLRSGGLAQRTPLLHCCYYKLKQLAKNI